VRQTGIARKSRMKPGPGGSLRRTGIAPGEGMTQGRNTGSRAGKSPAAGSQSKSAARRGTGFSRAVKLAARTRAGNGDPEDSRCECCGCWLGRDGGQVQHRLARASGGSSNPLVSSLSNAALLCGTSLTGCHGEAESRRPDRAMKAKGFVIDHGVGPDFDPRYVPIALGSQFGSGMRVWLAEDGIGDTGYGYLFQSPEVQAA
jgi:hypothetical protein